MLIVYTPRTFAGCRHYALEVILGGFLGLEWRYEVGDVANIRIRLADSRGEMRMPDVFFRHSEEHWLGENTLPSQPLAQWDTRDLASDIVLVEPVIPVICGDARPAARVEDQRIDLPIDIFGSAFFMLSRYEEAVRPERDSHDRFPATASLAYQEGFLDRPIIDEYVEILWVAMQRLWPQLQRKPRTRTLRVTCDLDSPYQVDFSGYGMARGIAADLLRRCSPRLALGNLDARWRARRGDFSGDPHLDNIDWMMDINEQAGNRMAFYFITGGTHRLDGRYRMDEPVIRALLRRVYERNHEIGLHPSYNTYQSPEQTQREADILRDTLNHERIPYAGLGGRQHYLRWQTPQTARNCEAAGMSYDCTLSYADRPGFRCGTSREFTMYDVVGRKPMKLKERPLVLMDCSVVADHYMAMGYSDEALAYMQTLKERALSFGGEFTLLWHNSYLREPEARNFYQELIHYQVKSMRCS